MAIRIGLTTIASCAMICSARIQQSIDLFTTIGVLYTQNDTNVIVTPIADSGFVINFEF